MTTGQFVDEVRALAKGFIAAGVQPGEALAIMSPTRYEWALADMAAWFAGAVVVPVYETSAAPQVIAILADAEVRLAVAGTAEHAVLLEQGFDEAGMPRPWGSGPWTPAPGADLADLVQRGAGVVRQRRWRSAACWPTSTRWPPSSTPPAPPPRPRAP